MYLIRSKIPLIIQPSFWVLAALISWLSSPSVPVFCMWMVVILFSVLVHELGHALLAKMWGLEVRIELGPMGGLTSYQGRKLSRLKEFVVVLMGPLFGLFLGFTAYLLIPYVKNSYAITLLGITFWANMIWSILNLAPVHPLDGGKLMKLGLEGIFGTKGTRLSYILSGLFAVFFSVLCFAKNAIFPGAIFFLFAFESYRAWQQSRFTTAPSSEAAITELSLATKEWQEKQPEKAIQRLEALARSEKGSSFGIHALETLANYLITTGETSRAFSHLYDAKSRLSFDGQKLLQLAAYKLANYKVAYEVGSLLFLETQDMQVAIMNAFSAARLSDVESALSWLVTLKKSKLMDMASIFASVDFDSIRSDPRFLQLK